MKGIIDTTKLISYAKYAEANSSDAQPLSRQRVIQLVKEKRLVCVEIAGKKFIHKDAKIKPSKKKLGRPKLKK